MIQIELSSLIDKLNQQSKLALEQAGALCLDKKSPEVTVAHFLHSLLENPLADIRVLLKKTHIDHQALRDALLFQEHHETSVESYPSFSPLLIEALQESWLLSTTELDQTELRSGAFLLAVLKRAPRYLMPKAADLLSPINREVLQSEFASLLQDSSENPSQTSDKAGQSTLMSPESSVLNKYCVNLTQQAKDNELDPVLCRDPEIDQMINILCRRRKNNPIVVGDAGVGKSAVIEGLAQRIAAGKVPEKLNNISLYSLDLGLLQAGASVKGEFEKRLKGIIDEIKHAPESIILFIDEVHTLIGSGNAEGTSDGANLLKPALARGELSTIGATTWKEYKKYFEKDPALTRRFQLVKLDEPSVEQSVDILRGLSGVYEKDHGVLISDDALRAASELSARYISGRQLPDKAIDVLDTACARISINLSSPPKQLSLLETKLLQMDLEIQSIERAKSLYLEIDQQRYDELLTGKHEYSIRIEELRTEWQHQKELVETIINLRDQQLNPDEDEKEHDENVVSIEQQLREAYLKYQNIEQNKRLIHPEVDHEQIAEVVADWTGVPVDQMRSDELDKITQLSDILGETIKGQDVAIKTVHRHLLTARADLRRPGRPKGAFLLVGPSGVGKTETVVQLAEQLYGGQQYLTTINMSEYQEKHTVSRLIGSPPGYVGYGEGGVLTEAIRKKPYSVVLLDEVEKAHPEVLNLFYQAFDKGELADGEGRKIDCQNIVFFLTSNLGFQTIVDHQSYPEQLEKALYPELADFFKPALLARMEVVPYLPLNKETLAEIVKGKLSRLERLFAERYSAQVTVEDTLVDEILLRATRSENGARMLEAIIDGQLLPPVSLALLNKLASNEPVKAVRLAAADGELIGEVD